MKRSPTQLLHRSLMLSIAMLAVLAVPAAATHRPGHQGGGGGGGTPGFTVAANPFVVVFGSATTVSGKLTGPNSTGQRVTLEEDAFPYGDGYVAVSSTTTGTTGATSGDYSFRLFPRTNRNYRLTARGVQVFTGVRVRTRHTLYLSDYTPRRGQLVRFFGFVYPRHDGRVLLIQRRNAAGVYVTVASTVLRASTITRSSFSRTFRVFSSGSYRTLLGSDGDHITGIGPARYARVG